MRPREVVRRYLEVVKRDLGATGAVIAPYTAAQLVLLILIAFGPGNPPLAHRSTAVVGREERSWIFNAIWSAVLLDVRLREVASSKLGDFKLVGALLCVAGFIVAQYGQTISTPRCARPPARPTLHPKNHIPFCWQASVPQLACLRPPPGLVGRTDDAGTADPERMGRVRRRMRCWGFAPTSSMLTPAWL